MILINDISSHFWFIGKSDYGKTATQLLGVSNNCVAVCMLILELCSGPLELISIKFSFKSV